MSSEFDEFESALRALVPRRSTIDRDRLMFLAGQASVRPRPRPSSRLWPLATLLSTAALVALAFAHWMTPPAVQVVREIVQVEVPRIDDPATPNDVRQEIETDRSEAPVAINPSAKGYLELRRRVLAEGIDALPASPSYERTTPGRQLSRDELMAELLEVGMLPTRTPSEPKSLDSGVL